MEFTTTDGTRIHYEVSGPASGTPVLLVHGHPFDRTLWDPQARALAAAGYRVVTPDLRGYGRSEVVPGTTAFEVFAGDLAELLDHLGLERAVVGGVSMGGQLTMEFHRLFPGRVLALVLADTSPRPETEDGKAFRRALADRLVAEGMGGYADEVIDKMITPAHVAALPEVAAHVMGMMRGTDPEGAAAALRGRAERTDHRPGLAAARVPVLVVVGEEDAYTPVADAEELHALVPESVLVVIPGAGHLPGVEAPEAFNAALLEFLAKV
ncbi:alpha/beta fold hydrolase [Streptomyces sp. NPDC086023]|uniref:alpha/beta fold hydrolase n=1 Tax=Streptomyces sp. NPDC086023 TaxID=3365746 RepID=UPI0037D6CDF6